jgi:hypothetical protein
MLATQFYSLRNSVGDFNLHRKIGLHAKSGVYFWGFNLREDNNKPRSYNDIIIWYIGTHKNIVSRIFEEVAQIIFGGFGTIIDYKYLVQNPTNARLLDLQESDCNRTKPLHHAVLYKADGLHVLYHFFDDHRTQETLKWMRERLIFAWIEADASTRHQMESEMHHIVGTNCFGVKGGKAKKDIHNSVMTPFFHMIDWDNNLILKEWLIKVNEMLY